MWGRKHTYDMHSIPIGDPPSNPYRDRFVDGSVDYSVFGRVAKLATITLLNVAGIALMIDGITGQNLIHAVSLPLYPSPLQEVASGFIPLGISGLAVYKKLRR